jgi:hypothetical protein
VERAWANRLPDCDFLFQVEGKPVGLMRSELRRTCQVLGIPYDRGTGIVFHDTRHSAVRQQAYLEAQRTKMIEPAGHDKRARRRQRGA